MDNKATFPHVVFSKPSWSSFESLDLLSLAMSDIDNSNFISFGVLDVGEEADVRANSSSQR